jgi:hypothetical protein
MVSNRKSCRKLEGQVEVWAGVGGRQPSIEQKKAAGCVLGHGESQGLVFFLAEAM